MKAYCVSGGTASRIIDHGTRRWVVSFMPRPLYFKETASGTHWVGGCVGPRDVLDAVVKRKFPAPAGTRTSDHPALKKICGRKMEERKREWSIVHNEKLRDLSRSCSFVELNNMAATRNPYLSFLIITIINEASKDVKYCVEKIMKIQFFMKRKQATLKAQIWRWCETLEFISDKLKVVIFYTNCKLCTETVPI